MPSEKGPFEKLIQIAENHRLRAQEGRSLLSGGQSLGRMTIQPVGLTAQETNVRRQGYVDELSLMPEDKLRQLYANNLHILNRRYDDPDRGTSELEWRRLAMEMEFEKRGLPLPPQ